MTIPLCKGKKIVWILTLKALNLFIYTYYIYFFFKINLFPWLGVTILYL